MQDKIGKSKQCDFSLISTALMLAAEGHANQRRKSDDAPYINHLIDVMSLLVTIEKVIDSTILCAAILHDSLEDTNITQASILEEFGEDTLNIINALTDDKSLTLAERRKYILNKLPNSSPAIKLIKLADICSNASAIPAGWDLQRIKDYFTWLDTVAKACRPSSEALYQEYMCRRRLNHCIVALQ
jgi:(p)ppGpp synthase/HD superfamily hydrolase